MSQTKSSLSSAVTSIRWPARTLALLLALCLILSGLPASATTPPRMPHAFYGTVTVAGALAGEGTAIKAYADGVLAAETTVNDQGEYALEVPGTDGDQVTFKVGATWANETASWQFGKIQQLNLTVGALESYALTIAVSPAGSGTTTPGVGTHAYAAGTVVNLMASPAAGYQFVNWTGQVGTVANANAASTTITMNGNYSITGSFSQEQEDVEPVQYRLAISSTVGGKVTDPGEGIFYYEAGRVVNLVAEAAEGYRFVNWTGSVYTIADRNAASTTITMNGNYSITANFSLDEEDESEPPAQYRLGISSTVGGGVTTPGEGMFNYNAGDVLDLVAEAEEGYHFEEWTGDVDTIDDVSAAATTITMNGDYSITAGFSHEGVEPVLYDLTISSSAGGTLTTPGAGTFTCNAGTVVHLVASPAAGYQFVNWTGQVGTIANPSAASTAITMKGNYTITANFISGIGAPPWDCLIATAAYDTPMAQEIQVLRQFRDIYLVANPLGQFLVNLYYRGSPPVAEFISGRPALKAIVRVGLLPAVAMSSAVVSTTPPQKLAMAGLVVLISVGLVAWAARRRCRVPQYT